MKKSLLFILLLLPLMAFGQSHSMGLKIGPNLGWLGGKDFIDALEAADAFGQPGRGVRIGFSVGAFLTLGLIENLAVQFEILYTYAGGTYSYRQASQIFEGEQGGSAIEIPLLLKTRIRLWDNGYMYLLIGPELVSMLGFVKDTLEGSMTAWVPDNDIVFGFVAGLGYENKIGAGIASTEVRFSRNLTGFFEDYDSAVNIVSVMIGYGILF